MTGTIRRPASRREQLRGFLQSRRARLAPEAVGLRVDGRRGTPGLRREEVALLAGVSASWYTWLEQGRDIKVSGRVLDAVSSALRLDETERAYLYRLTGLNPPPSVASLSEHATEGLARVVESWHPAPAFAVDRYWNTLAANAAAGATLGLPGRGCNQLSAFFTEPGAKERFPRWGEIAVRLVGRLREQAARFPDDPEFALIVRRLWGVSADFQRLWRLQVIEDQPGGQVELRLPDGPIRVFDQVELAMPGSADGRIVLLVPTRDSY